MFGRILFLSDRYPGQPFFLECRSSVADHRIHLLETGNLQHGVLLAQLRPIDFFFQVNTLCDLDPLGRFFPLLLTPDLDTGLLSPCVSHPRRNWRLHLLPSVSFRFLSGPSSIGVSGYPGPYPCLDRLVAFSCTCYAGHEPHLASCNGSCYRRTSIRTSSLPSSGYPSSPRIYYSTSLARRGSGTLSS